MASNLLWQMIKFTLFSISAGINQIGSFAAFNDLIKMGYWPSYLLSLSLSQSGKYKVKRNSAKMTSSSLPSF